MDVIKKRGIMEQILWECPKCGYLITDIAFMAARFDYLCHRCKEVTLSEFHMIQQELPNKPDDFTEKGDNYEKGN